MTSRHGGARSAGHFNVAANKTRVQVRGTVGKSVRFPTDTGSTGATIGLNFRLPDGSIPTLQQLAAALVTGSALQDQPGNIVPPGGGPTVIWQNIQYVPAPIKNPPRYVYQEEDGGEDYSRMAVPGPIGPRGFQGFPAVRADDPEDPMPGPPGQAGVAGAAGPPGVISAVHLWPDDPEDHVSIPGAAGPPGNNGAQGAPGLISAVHLWPDDAEDPGLIPGAPGQAGATGSAGPPGVISAVHLYPDDAEDAGLIPGPAGPQGATGATGPSGSSSVGVGWAAYLDQDWDDDLSALRALPNDPRFKTVTIDAPASLTGLTVNGAASATLYAVRINGSSTSGQSLGLNIVAGTTSADAPLTLTNQANTVNLFKVDGNGLLTVQNNAAGTHTISSLNGASDTLALNAPSGRFTSCLFNNAGALKSQIYWDNTNNAFNFLTTGGGLVILSTGALRAATSPLASAATQVVTGMANRLSAATTRTSTTVLAAEAGMTVTCNEIGWYRVKMLVLFSEATSGAGGFIMDRNAGTATVVTPTFTCIRIDSTAGFSSFATLKDLTTTYSTPTTAVSPALDMYQIEGVINVTVAGTFGIRWAQNSSSANATSLAIGSHIVLTKIA